MRTKVIIPCRGGSVRVPNKNIKPFCGTSLLEIAIKKWMSLVPLFVDEVIVNSDDDAILKVASDLGATVYKRPEHLATSETNPKDLAYYIASNIEADRVVYAHCTSPFISVKTMIEMLRMDMQGHDSINTASLIKKHLWLGDRPINYDPMNRPNTQLLPDIFALNYAINIISRYHMLEYSDFIGRNPKLFVVPDIEAIDIDTPEDWQMAEALYNVL